MVFNLYILPSVWVTKLTAESLQNLIQPSSPCQTSAQRCQFTFSLSLSHSQFTLNPRSLSALHSSFERFSLISQVQHGYCILRKANNPCYHNSGRFYFSSCSTCMELLLIQSAVDFNEASSVSLVSFPFIIWTTLLSLPCCSRMSHGMSETAKN